MPAQIDGAVIVGLVVAAFCLVDVAFWIVVACAMARSEKNAQPPAIRPVPNKSSKREIVVGVAVTLFWSSITLTADWFIGRMLIKELDSQRYVSVLGEVSRCEVKEKAGDEGPLYYLDIDYSYEVNGQKYVGHRIGAVRISTSSQAAQVALAAEYPVNCQTTVFYDPDDPARAVLVPGLSGHTLFVAYFMLPFNVIMASMWFAFAAVSFFGKSTWAWFCNGLRVIERDEAIRIRLPTVFPAGAFALFLSLGMIPFMLCLGCCTGLSPPSSVMIGVWVLALLGGPLLFFGLSWRVGSGRYDLVIDLLQRTVTLPRTFGRKELTVFPLGKLRDVRVDRVEKKASEGTTVLFGSSVCWQEDNGAIREGKIAEWSNGELALELADLIRVKTGLQPASAQPRPAG